MAGICRLEVLLWISHPSLSLSLALSLSLPLSLSLFLSIFLAPEEIRLIQKLGFRGDYRNKATIGVYLYVAQTF